jgi:carbon-monoxide dehydrogenase medium subunit
VLTALDGVVIARGQKGERQLTAAALFETYLTTTLAPDELLTEVRLPVMPAGAGWAFEEFARRHGDFALVGVAAALWREGGRWAARLATAGVGPVPVRLRDAEAIIARDGVGEEAVAAAAARAAELVQPDGDLHASADYRRNLTRVLTGRALRKAVGRAK